MTAGAQPRVLIRVWYHDAPSWRSQLLLSKPRVVFVLDLVSSLLAKGSLTSGKKYRTAMSSCHSSQAKTHNTTVSSCLCRVPDLRRGRGITCTRYTTIKRSLTWSRRVARRSLPPSQRSCRGGRRAYLGVVIVAVAEAKVHRQRLPILILILMKS